MTTNIVSLPMADRHLASVSDAKKSSVSPITRTKQEEFAIRLRELARQVDSGSVAYCVTYSVDLHGKVGELEFNKTAHGKPSASDNQGNKK
jgi:hypothetical protein